MLKLWLFLSLYVLVSSKRPAPSRTGYVKEVLNLGKVSQILGSENSFSASDCSVVIHEDTKTTGGTHLQVLDTDPNEIFASQSVKPRVPPFLLASLGTKSCNISYTLTCKEEQTTGHLEVVSVGSVVTRDWSAINLEIGSETANTTSFVQLRGIEGNSISFSLDSKSTDEDYYDEFISGTRSIGFYQRKNDGELEPVNMKTFDKILPVDPPDNLGNYDLIEEKGLSSTVVVIMGQSTAAYYSLENDPNFGRVYVHIGNKEMKPGDGYQLDTCFPAYEGTSMVYYCAFSKSGSQTVLLDVSATEEVLDPQVVPLSLKILAGKSISDGRLCLLAVDNESNQVLACFEHSRFEFLNEENMFSAKVLSIDVREDCELKIAEIDAAKFRFDESAIFTCKDGKQILAAISLPSSTADNQAKVHARSAIFFTKDQYPLCGNENELIFLENSNKTVVFKGGFEAPGQDIRIDLGIDGRVDDLYCGTNRVLFVLSGSKKSNLIAINRQTRGIDLTRIESILDLSAKQSKIVGSLGDIAFVHGQDSSGHPTDVLEYTSGSGFLKIINKEAVQTKDPRKALVIARSGKLSSKIWIQTRVFLEKQLTVEKKQPFKDLKPGKSYELRNYFDIDGQITDIQVTSPEKPPKTVYWRSDRVAFAKVTNDSASGAKFALGNKFIHTANRSIINEDGSFSYLEGDILHPSRYLGSVNVDKNEVALAGKMDAGTMFIQGWMLDKDAKVTGSGIVQLQGKFNDDYATKPRLYMKDGKTELQFFKGEHKATSIQIEITSKNAKLSFVEESQKEVPWDSSTQIGNYKLHVEQPELKTRLGTCVHFSLKGPDADSGWIYPVCNVTGGSSSKVTILSFEPNERSVTFDMINYPAPSIGINSVTWWRVSAAFLDAEGKPLHPAKFRSTVTFLRRLGGLSLHEIISLHKIGNEVVAFTSKKVGNRLTLQEVYFGEAGDHPYLISLLSREAESIKNFDFGLFKMADGYRRLFNDHEVDFSSSAQVVYEPARLVLSNHTATAHVKNPFNLLVNSQVEVKNVLIYLDDYYEDDGKTDEDDDKPKPPPIPDPPVPESPNRISRLWYIAGILLLIIVVALLDLWLRKRSAASENGEDRKAIVRKKKPQDDLSSSLNDEL